MKSLATSAHAVMESPSSYSIVLNLLGIEQKDIGIKIDKRSRELAVLARKETYACKRGFFWVFGVPAEGVIESITSRYQGGVLEIVIPKAARKRLGTAA